MRLPIQFHGSMVRSSRTYSTVPERGNCFVCNPTSDTILLIQFVALLVIFLIILTHIWPSKNSDHRQDDGEEDKETNIACDLFGFFTFLWLIAFLVHAIIKFNIDPNASDGENHSPTLRHKKSWAHLITQGTMNLLAFIVALIILVVVVESVKKFWGVCGPGNSWGEEIDGDVERVVDEETPLRRDEFGRPQHAARRPQDGYLCEALGSGIMIGLCKCLFC